MRQMVSFSLRFCAKLYIYVTLLVIFYIEYASYNVLPFQWTRLQVCKPPACSKILLVADPQIIGSQISGHNIINFLEKWDSDRYIKRTFLQAFDYVRPEIVIFLGDLMDEGHISSDNEYFDDLRRFLNIFQLSKWTDTVARIFLPGDNDIGGIDDIMLPQYVHRFNKIFNQSDGPLSHQLLEFYKVNIMTYQIQEPNFIDTNNIDNTLRIALSHVPLLPNPTPFFERVIRRIRPHLIFSGHTHLSSHYITSESNVWKRKFNSISPNDTEGKMYKLHTGLIHEILVPTCSYRMGVRNMGYGAAFIVQVMTNVAANGPLLRPLQILGSPGLSELLNPYLPPLFWFGIVNIEEYEAQICEAVDNLREWLIC